MPSSAPNPPDPPDSRGPILFLLLLLMAGFLTVVWGLGREPASSPVPAAPPASPGAPLATDPSAPASPPSAPTSSAPAAPAPRSPLPGGGRRIFAGNRFLVAYYGTAETGALGVLGETEPDEMQHRVRRAARPFRAPGRPVQIVYELIVTIADRGPGPDGDFSHDIERRLVQRYVDAAHRHGALLLLDLQPGRSDFLEVARRWRWALEDPWVGLALDPEWRLGPHRAPAQVIGHVDAAEVNRTSRWLARLTDHHRLPQKLFVLHQFRTAMVNHVERVKPRPGLAMVQHVDGFGTRREKLATYHAVARPERFLMGLKIFYDEDRGRMGASAVHRIRPHVRFVSYQ
ncbi:MAG: hypothetical protein JWN22_825 [Nocardioides sp.]|nr:hypothetical protein [Nocardioides sp.]